MIEPMGNPGDAHLVELIRTDANDGIRRLLAVHGPAAKGRLLQQFGADREQDIENTMSDAACSIWQHIDRHDPAKGTLAGWFLTVARNNMLTLLRSERLQSLLSMLDPPSAKGTGHLAQTRSDRIQKLLDALPGCIAKLSPMCQDIILSGLAEPDGGDDMEIANRWSVRTNTVRQARFKARRRLGKLLHKETSP